MNSNVSHLQSDRSGSFLSKVLGLVFVIGGLALYYSVLGTFAPIAGNYLQLTREDLLMIPVGGVLFFIFWRAMSALLFDPHLALIAEREAATAGAEEVAQELRNRAKALTVAFDEKLTDARVEAMQEKIVTVNKAKEDAQAIIDEANRAAQVELAKIRQEIDQNTTALREDLLKDTDAIVEMITKKLSVPPAEVKDTVH